jgi:hypothetical protein
VERRVRLPPCRLETRERSARTAGSEVPATSASSMSRPELAEDVAGDTPELDPGVFEDLV